MFLKDEQHKTLRNSIQDTWIQWIYQKPKYCEKLFVYLHYHNTYLKLSGSIDHLSLAWKTLNPHSNVIICWLLCYVIFCLKHMLYPKIWRTEELRHSFKHLLWMPLLLICLLLHHSQLWDLISIIFITTALTLLWLVCLCICKRLRAKTKLWSRLTNMQWGIGFDYKWTVHDVLCSERVSYD